jgi:hypothetical protein
MIAGFILAASAATVPIAVEAPATTSSSVTPYPAAFFSSSQANTALEMLEHLPGFTFDKGADARGFSGGGNVLIDGERPASKTDDLESILRRVPAGQVERIDLIRGSVPGIDMQGKSVVANVVRRQSAGSNLVFSTGGRAFQDGRAAPFLRLESTRRSGATSLEAALFAIRYVDDFIGSGDRTRRLGDGSLSQSARVDAEGGGTQGSLTSTLSTPFAGGRAKINGVLAANHFRSDLDDLVSGTPTPLHVRDASITRRAEVGLRWSRPLGQGVQLETVGIQTIKAVKFRDTLHDNALTALFTSDANTTESILRAELTGTSPHNIAWRMGGEGAYNRLDNHTAYSRNAVAVPLPGADVVVDEKRGEAFGSVVWTPNPDLSIETGFRFEYSEIGSAGDVELSKTLRFAKPRLQISWSPWEKTQLRFREEREVDQLDFTDFVAAQSLNTGSVYAGNPDLDPAQTWVTEVAIERGFGKGGTLGLTLGHDEISDVIDRAPIFAGTDVFDAPANIGSGTRDRAAIEFALPLAMLGDASLKGDATWQRSEVMDPTTHRPREISDEEPVTSNLLFTQNLPARRMSWGLMAKGGYRLSSYRFNEIETNRTGAFVILFAEFKPSPTTGIRIELRNLTNQTLDRHREVFTGARNINGLDYVDRRRTNLGEGVFVRFRKTVG